jgi:oligo-alginate lyase
MIHDTFITHQELTRARAILKRLPLAAEVATQSVLLPAQDACRHPLHIPGPIEFRFPAYHAPDTGSPLHFNPRDINATRDASGRPVRGQAPDRAWANLVHNTNANDARTCALAAALFDHAPSADRARETLLAYAQAYHTYFPTGRASWTWGKVTCSGLEESIWLLSMLWAAETLFKIGRLTPGQVTLLRTNLFQPAIDLLWGDVPRIHNIRMWNNAAIGCVGFAFSDRAAIRHAVFGDFGFRQQTVDGFTPDAMQYEGSPGYHDYALSAMLFLAEAMARNEMRPYQETLLRDALLLPFQILKPDGKIPALNDCWAGAGIPTRLYATAALRYPEPQLAAPCAHAFNAWRASGYGPDTTVADWNHTPAYYARQQFDWLLALESLDLSLTYSPPASLQLKHAGLGIARPAPSSYALLKASRKGSGHDHHDKLSLIYWQASTPWLDDKGASSYSSNLHEGWFKTTLAHNTVTVDHLSHQRCDASLNDATQTHLAGSARPYPDAMPDVAFSRTIDLTPDSLSDTFTCSASQPRTFDYVLHPHGSLQPLGHTSEPLSQPLGPTPAYANLTSLRLLRLDADSTLLFSQPPAALTLDLSMLPPETRIYAAKAPCTTSDHTILGDVLILRITGLHARFHVRFTAASAPSPHARSHAHSTPALAAQT